MIDLLSNPRRGENGFHGLGRVIVFESFGIPRAVAQSYADSLAVDGLRNLKEVCDQPAEFWTNEGFLPYYWSMLAVWLLARLAQSGYADNFLCQLPGCAVFGLVGCGQYTHVNYSDSSRVVVT